MSREMKDSGIAWIGKIPLNWRCSLVKQHLRWKSEKGQPNERVLSLYRDYGIVPKDSRDDNHNVTSLDTSSYKVVDVGDFVINKMKAWQGSMAVSEYRGIVSPAYHVCSFTGHEINKRYLHHLLRCSAYLPEYTRLSTGLRVGQWDLGFDDFKNIPIICPPYEEQELIVSFIERQCAEINTATDKTRASIEEYKKLKQAVITQAVTKGIRGKRPMKDSQNNRWGYIPENWSFRRVKTCVTEIKSGLSAVTEDDTAEDSGFYVLRTSAVSTGVFIPTEVKPVLSTAIDRLICPVKKGTLIVSRMNTAAMVGMCAYVDAEYPNIFLPDKLWRIQVNESENAKFLWYSINATPAHAWFGELATGASASMQNITISDFSNNYIALPDKVEQDEIAEYLDRTCSEIDTLIAKKEQYLVELENYKKSLIYEYVTGKKEVR